jgi:hypothetical protein
MNNISQKLNKSQKEAYEYLKDYRSLKLQATIVSVAKSGMSRKIKFFIIKDSHLINITENIARLLESNEKHPAADGMRVSGCGTDMIFHTIVCLNYKIAEIEEVKLSGIGSDNSYSNYFFDADSYNTI